MMASTRARVFLLTYGASLMTRETVFLDTPERRAMSVMVSLPLLFTRFARDASRAVFLVPLTERLVVLTRLLIGLSLLRHRMVAPPSRQVACTDLWGDRTLGECSKPPARSPRAPRGRRAGAPKIRPAAYLHKFRFQLPCLYDTGY